jgi:uncharacterized protein (TIGR02117 family)
MLKKIIGFAKKLFLFLLIFIVIYLLAAFSLSSLATKKEMISSNDIEIYISTNGVHTDIVMPVKSSIINWSHIVLFKHTKNADTSLPYIATGWGDKSFFLDTPTWADLKFSTAFNASFGLNATAMHTTFCIQPRESANCKKIILSNNQYQRLTQFISSSFSSDEKGEYKNIITLANYNRNDAFYDANGRYSLFYTCNTCANNALKSCGQKACWWTPFDSGIFNLYR